MKKIITQWLYMQFDVRLNAEGRYDNFNPSWAPAVWPLRLAENKDRIFLRTMEIEVDIPDNFDPHEIAALEAKKAKATEAYLGLVAEINERISKLQTIGYSGSTP